jgi:excisionase family DNA binding protein
MTDDWMTVKDAAKLSGFHIERVRELIREKRIKARRFSILWLVSRRSLLAYLKKQEATHGKKRGRPKKSTA